MHPTSLAIAQVKWSALWLLEPRQRRFWYDFQAVQKILIAENRLINYCYVNVSPIPKSMVCASTSFISIDWLKYQMSSQSTISLLLILTLKSYQCSCSPCSSSGSSRSTHFCWTYPPFPESINAMISGHQNQQNKYHLKCVNATNKRIQDPRTD